VVEAACTWVQDAFFIRLGIAALLQSRLFPIGLCLTMNPHESRIRIRRFSEEGRQTLRLFVSRAIAFE
jgi:hypothetical protein